ncbi:MAG TPA: hypothetical protein RMF84_21040 [Polyangiaceae bacterium LLY-WYZ-14_1]|nr:hypothetical protein [Polyangiaceae bacterium LLY-WYZ-14_1]
MARARKRAIVGSRSRHLGGRGVTFVLLVAVSAALPGQHASAEDAPASGDGEARAASENGAGRRPLRGYLQLGWRGMGLADHASHGPEVGFGAVLFDVVKVGFFSLARPGPLNPRTFDLDLPAGETYRGRSTVPLRSDGSVLGLAITPFIDLPVAEGVRLELPLAVGYGAFGFYLTGDDRQTPDGRRVSEWEDELLAGRDASGGLAIDLGGRVAFGLPGTDVLRPYVALHHTWIVGYDAALRSSYDGLSGALGLLIETP